MPYYVDKNGVHDCNGPEFTMCGSRVEDMDCQCPPQWQERLCEECQNVLWEMHL